MGRLRLATVVAALLGATSALAQSPAMVTSPLGVIGSTPAATMTAIPLGSVEIDVGGFGPPASTTCAFPGLSGPAATGGPVPTFDGGGLAGNATDGASCSADAATLPTTIPLGATEITTPGIDATPPPAMPLVPSTPFLDATTFGQPPMLEQPAASSAGGQF